MIIAPDDSVRLNVTIHQLGVVIKKAEAGGYGERSAALLAARKAELEQALAEREALYQNRS